MLLFIFITCFALSRINVFTLYISESKIAGIILNKTPIVAKISSPTYNSLTEIYNLQKKYAKDENKSNYNRESLMILIKYNVISKEQARDLVKKGKIKIDNPESFIIV